MPSTLMLLPHESAGVPLVELCTLDQAALRSGFYTSETMRNNNESEKEKGEHTYRFEPLAHVGADGVVATHLRLDHTEHALVTVLGDRAVEELCFFGLDNHVDYTLCV